MVPGHIYMVIVLWSDCRNRGADTPLAPLAQPPLFSIENVHLEKIQDHIHEILVTALLESIDFSLHFQCT